MVLKAGQGKKNGTVCLLKNKYKEKGELNSIILESNDLILENNSSLIVDTKSLTFETSPKERNTICEKTNKLSAKEQITLMGARLGNAQVASDNGTITIIDGDIHDATVHFSNAGDESSNGVIKDADIRYSDLREINGILTNELFNCKANNVTFKGKNSLNAKEVVVIYDGRFDRASIKSDSERLSVIKQCMVTNSTISVKPMSKQGPKDFELRNFDAYNCVIDNVTGNISHSMMRNTTITNSAFFNNAKLIVGVRDRQGSEHSTSINNLTLKKNTTLILQSLMNGNNKRALNNSIVEEGEILVTNKNGYEINNSLLNNGKIELNNEENMVISNSNIKGKIYLQNISGIDCAILENSTIVAKKSMPIEDAEIKEKNIQDYYLYQKSFRNHIEQEQKDIGKADAQNWEVL